MAPAAAMSPITAYSMAITTNPSDLYYWSIVLPPSYAAVAAISSHADSQALGIKLIARSVKAAIVRLGFTPRLAEMTDPSQTYIFL